MLGGVVAHASGSADDDPLGPVEDSEAVAGKELAAGLCLGGIVDMDDPAADKVLGLTPRVREARRLQRPGQRDMLIAQGKAVHQDIVRIAFSDASQKRKWG